MKKFITILVLTTISVVLSIHAKADNNKGEWYPDHNRSISIYLDIEENDLHIYSDKEYDCVHIQVVDVNGIMIYSDIINIPTNERAELPGRSREIHPTGYPTATGRCSDPLSAGQPV